MPSKTSKQKFDLTVQRDEHGQYYVQRSFNDNVEMEEWLQKFANQTLQINNLKRDLQRANAEIKKLIIYENLYNQVFYERVKETTRADNAERQVCNKIRQYDSKINKQKVSYTEYVEGLMKILDQVEKGDKNGR